MCIRDRKGTVTVAIPMDWHPIYCKGGGKELHDGVLPDLLREITAFTGLQFTFLYGDNYADCIRMVQQLSLIHIWSWARRTGLRSTRPT